jgi:transposase, IS5 family
MRKRFEQHFIIGRTPIQDIQIPTKARSGALPGLCAALQEIFVTPEWNEKVFGILEEKILSKNNTTGRPGMDLWQLFVLAQVRLCQNLSYDELHDLANHHSLIREIMGVESGFGHDKFEFSYRSILDNVSLLDDETLKAINTVIVEFGHEVFKKKEDTALRLKTDSFVVECNVHFPTDYNLLWDCARKSTDIIKKFSEKHKLHGWRKLKNWRNDLKNKMRALGQASASGGKGKQERIKKAAHAYLGKAKALYQKLSLSKPTLPQHDIIDAILFMELERFMGLFYKHIDLLERRIIKGEEIPHAEKMFSIFEDYTEWITKGKMRPNVELGKKTAITTDQYHLIVDYRIMDHQCDSEIVKDLAKELIEQYQLASWSFDKGFWHKENKAFLTPHVQKLVMPKKGKCNKQEQAEEQDKKFKVLRNKHSAVESNINELEHRGLDRCPDKGFKHFKRYIGLAVCAYNLRKIGEELIEQRRAQEQKREAA